MAGKKIQAFAMAALLFCCQAAWAATPEAQVESVFDLNGKVLGILVGTSHDNAANTALDYTQIEYFDDVPALLNALNSGDVDGILSETPVARWIAARDPTIRRLRGVLKIEYFAFAFRQDEKELFANANKTLRQLLASGVIDGLVEKWVDSTVEPTPASRRAATGDKVIRMGVAADCPPFSFENANGAMVGFDIELAERIAEQMGYRLDIKVMEYAQLLPSLFYGRVDMVSSCLTVNDERKQLVQFTDTYYTSGVTGLVRDE